MLGSKTDQVLLRDLAIEDSSAFHEIFSTISFQQMDIQMQGTFLSYLIRGRGDAPDKILGEVVVEHRALVDIAQTQSHETREY